jgi:hypothetical protein
MRNIFEGCLIKSIWEGIILINTVLIIAIKCEHVIVDHYSSHSKISDIYIDFNYYTQNPLVYLLISTFELQINLNLLSSLV